MENGAGEGYQTYKWNVELDVLVLRFEKVWKEDMNLGGFFFVFWLFKANMTRSTFMKEST